MHGAFLPPVETQRLIISFSWAGLEWYYKAFCGILFRGHFNHDPCGRCHGTSHLIKLETQVYFKRNKA
jgi:hypothetical protein